MFSRYHVFTLSCHVFTFITKDFCSSSDHIKNAVIP